MNMISFRHIVLFGCIVLLVFLNVNQVFACSGYKITKNGKTFFGSNEDAWRLTPHLWFETAKTADTYGAAFTGSRWDGKYGYAPQTGMNEVGLAFERLASYHPVQKATGNKKPITEPTNFLKEVLKRCKTVEEVKAFYSQYDHSYFIEDVFIYVDSTGKYLIVEPYQLTIGNEPTYVIANFCPSITDKEKAFRMDRYRNGVEFIEKEFETSFAYCRELSKAMHVSRLKIGDGTLLTSNWNLNDLTFQLYFYHDYEHSISYDLKTELAKGDHIIALPELFPPNKSFKQLEAYQIPQNNMKIGLMLVGFGGLFFVTALFFLVQMVVKNSVQSYRFLPVILIVLGLLFTYYMFVLVTNMAIFYFPAPYQDATRWTVTLTSYFPYLLLLIILPFWYLTFQLFRQSNWGKWSIGLVTLNLLAYTVLIGFFVYWQFYFF